LETAQLVPLWLTLKLATISTLLLLLLGTPLAWWLARTHSRFKNAIEAVIALPLVLPPTVLGFYLLIGLSPDGIIGGPWHAMTGSALAFTFKGLVIGSVMYSLPFVVQPLQNTFQAIGNDWLEAAATLRARPLDRFLTVVVPLSKGGFITATTLGFAHTVGEFGVVLMIGGNIPGKTQVISIAIYDHVEALEYTQAHWLSAGLLLFSFLVLFMVFALNRRWQAITATK
jgi:molybdate transport system permease protein